MPSRLRVERTMWRVTELRLDVVLRCFVPGRSIRSMWGRLLALQIHWSSAFHGGGLQRQWWTVVRRGSGRDRILDDGRRLGLRNRGLLLEHLAPVAVGVVGLPRRLVERLIVGRFASLYSVFGIRLLERVAAHGTERLALGSFDLSGIRAPAALEIQVLANRVVQESHRLKDYSALRTFADRGWALTVRFLPCRLAV
jgi:hypothetical protein